MLGSRKTPGKRLHTERKRKRERIEIAAESNEGVSTQNRLQLIFPSINPQSITSWSFENRGREGGREGEREGGKEGERERGQFQLEVRTISLAGKKLSNWTHMNSE